MDSTQNQLAPQRKSFWKMVKTIFIPAQAIARLMAGCGGGKGRKVKRRLTMRNMQEAKDIFIRASLQRSSSSAHRSHSTSTRQIQQSSVSTSTDPTQNSSIETNDYDPALYPFEVTMTTPYDEFPIAVPQSNFQNSDSTFPAPLNMEEAQSMLESLTIRDSNQNEIETNFEYADADEDESHDFDEPEPEPSSRVVNDYNMSRSVGNINMGESSSSEHEESATTQTVIMRRSRTTASLATSSSGAGGFTGDDFHGWRKSSIEVSSNPPVTLAFIPSGLCVGDRIVWVRDDSPEIGTVRWIGKIRSQFYAGVEFDKPIGNSSGIYGYGIGSYKRLFTCQLPYGRFIPVKELILYKDYHDPGVKSGIVCIICRDDFLDTWEPSESDGVTATASTSAFASTVEQQAFHMVSTRCGHLYHFGCLDHWFSTKKPSELHCPFCLRPLAYSDVIRIFPSQI